MESLNENEMKQVNEEILKTWRETGFLAGLPENSQIEWRIAKSMDLINDYLNEVEDFASKVAEYNDDNTEVVNPWRMYIFAIIRRCLSSVRPRVTKIIKPQELMNIMTNNTIEDMFSECEKHRKTHSPNSEIKFGYLRRYFKAEDMNEMKIVCLADLFKELSFKKLGYILDVDLEAEMVALMSLFISIKMNEK